MDAITLQVYEILKEKFDKKKASIVIDYLEGSISDKVQSKTEHLSTKEDLQKVKSEIVKWMFWFWIATVGIGIILIVISFLQD